MVASYSELYEEGEVEHINRFEQEKTGHTQLIWRPSLLKYNYEDGTHCAYTAVFLAQFHEFTGENVDRTHDHYLEWNT